MSGEIEAWPPVDLIEGLALEAPPLETELDPNVLKELPQGLKVLSITLAGASAWVQTVRIETRQQDGRRKTYFKKNKAGNLGRRMMLGTFESERAVHTYLPSNVPKPIAWGNHQSNDQMYFYLAEFHDMIEEVPDPIQFVDLVVQLHRDSSGKAPKGLFGFDVPTHLANIPNRNQWVDTWEECYSQALSSMMKVEALSQDNSDQNFEDLKKQTMHLVLPRLLRPLESGGRKIVACLIHTDLWPGNCMPDVDTDELMLFDSCALWGHNEADLGSWRAPRYRMGRPFIHEYQRRMGMDYPEDEWDDRNMLYALRYDLLVSALFPNTDKFRNYAKDIMKYLANKYSGGFESWKEGLGRI